MVQDGNYQGARPLIYVCIPFLYILTTGIRKKGHFYCSAFIVNFDQLKNSKSGQILHAGSSTGTWKQNSQISFLLILPAEPFLKTVAGLRQIAVRVKHIERLLSIHTLLQDRQRVDLNKR